MSLDISLDPRNEEEILQQAIQFLYEKSNGQLTNLNPSNPLIFLLEAQVFSNAELLWYVNKLPTKLLYYFYRLFNDELNAVKAIGMVRVTLTSALSTDYTINHLELTHNGLFYRLKNPLIIPANNLYADGVLEADDFGSKYNAPSFAINQIVTPIPYVQSAVNISEMQGGLSDDDADVIDRFIQQFRDNQIISLDDYEQQIRLIVGNEYLIRVRYDEGVRILIGHPYETINAELIRSIYATLSQRAILTAPIFIHPARYQHIDLVLEVESTSNNPDTVYQHLIGWIPNQQKLDQLSLGYELAQIGFQLKDAFFNLNEGIIVANSDEILNLHSMELQLNGNRFVYGESEDKV